MKCFGMVSFIIYTRIAVGYGFIWLVLKGGQGDKRIHLWLFSDSMDEVEIPPDCPADQYANSVITWDQNSRGRIILLFRVIQIVM